MTRHELKIWPEYFAAILDGSKTFEVRVYDRKFMEGDTLVLREYDIDTDTYTGRQVERRVGWMTGWVDADDQDEYVGMSLLPVDNTTPTTQVVASSVGVVAGKSTLELPSEAEPEPQKDTRNNAPHGGAV